MKKIFIIFVLVCAVILSAQMMKAKATDRVVTSNDPVRVSEYQMPKVVEYVMIRCEWSLFETKVQEMLAKGYQPFGGVSMYSNFVSQAMVRYELPSPVKK